MLFVQTALSAGAIAMFMATGALMVSTQKASAGMACNAQGACWHTGHDPDYRQGRGYYKDGIWNTL